MPSVNEINDILRNTLVLAEDAIAADPESPLLGAVRELDSVGIMAVVNALEEAYDIEIDDEEISAEVFMTLGTLARFVEDKAE